MSKFSYADDDESAAGFVYPSEEDVQKHFSLEEWTAMSDYEKITYCNKLHNYTVMQSLGKNKLLNKYDLVHD